MFGRPISGRKSSLRLAAVVTAYSLLPAAGVWAQTSPGTAVSADPFEVFGLLYSGSAPGGYLQGDAWAQGASYLGVLDADGLPARDANGVPFRASRQIDGNWGNQGDGIDYTLFASGNKNDDLIGAGDGGWEWGIGGGGPQKNDITNAYFHTRVDPVTGDRWVFVGAETRSINGDSHVDFEFNQAGVVKLGDTGGTLVGMGPDGGRTINDFLITVDFVQGGDFPVANARFWDGTQFVDVYVNGNAYSATNLVDIDHSSGGSWKHYTSDGAETGMLTHLQLVEAGINLTGLNIQVDPCATDATFMVKTRSSSSWTSDLKDFAIVYFPLEPPPEIEFTRPDTVCIGETFDVTATELTGLHNTAIEWGISGCGSIISEPAGATVTVQADPTCHCEIHLSATITGGYCSHQVTAETVVQVDDTTDPILSGRPADEIVECDAVPEPPSISATDDCVDPEVRYGEVSEPGACEGAMTLLRKWEAVDQCENVGDYTQVIVVQDTTAPTLVGVPDDGAASCDAVPEAAIVTAEDNCSTPAVELVETIEPGSCPATYTLLRTWTGTDDCDNAVSRTQTIAIADTAAPVLTGVPDDATYECDSLPPPAEVTADDNCTGVSLGFDEQTEPGACIGASTVSRTWTADDECGNSSSETQLITLQDTTAPVIQNGPADALVECSNVPDPPVVTATDNCSEPVVTLVEQNDVGPGEGKGLVTRTWTATDSCGNTSSHTQVLIVVDTTAPTLEGLPEDATVECSAVPDPPVVTASDNCASPAVEFGEVTVPGDCVGRWIIRRTWTATDDCGNTTAHTQTITVVDTAAPAFGELPSDITAECDAVPPPAAVEATDLCSEVSIDFHENAEPGACLGESTITRTWIARDACGNESQHIQTVHVVDTTDPVLSDDPADITVECDSVPAPITLSAQDNCTEELSVSFLETETPGPCDGSYALLREWSTADDCGNAAAADRVVTVEDTTAPTIRLEPNGTRYICDGKPVTWMLSATDNCSEPDLAVDGLTSITANSRDRVNITELPNGGIRITANGPALIVGTATATDDCGNAGVSLNFRVMAEHGFEACSQGFWKNHYERWGPTGFSPGDRFVDAFQITDLTSPELPADFDQSLTLGEAINKTGGSLEQLLLQGTAALLNAAHPLVDYPYTLSEVRTVMQAAFAGTLTIDEARAFINTGQAAERECGCSIQ